MAKSEVYSWRLSPELKAALEREAKREQRPLSELLEDIVRRWLAEAERAPDEQEQRRLRQAALASCGTIHGGRPDRSERARELLREKLSRQRDA